MRFALRVSAVAAALTLAATAGHAQSNFINATASVYQAIQVAAGQDLTFGNVFPGVAKTVLPTDASAGRFDLTGQANAAVTVSFTLPANLASGGNLLPIGTWTGVSNTTNNAAGGATFVPTTGATPSFSGTGTLWVFLGGTVSPGANQPAGTYTNTVTLTAAYF